MACKASKIFDFSSCTFSNTADKRNTLRSQMVENGVINCITVECSYFGYWEDSNKKLFKRDDYIEMSQTIIKALCLIAGDNI